MLCRKAYNRLTGKNYDRVSTCKSFSYRLTLFHLNCDIWALFALILRFSQSNSNWSAATYWPLGSWRWHVIYMESANTRTFHIYHVIFKVWYWRSHNDVKSVDFQMWESMRTLPASECVIMHTRLHVRMHADLVVRVWCGCWILPLCIRPNICSDVPSRSAWLTKLYYRLSTARSMWHDTTD